MNQKEDNGLRAIDSQLHELTEILESKQNILKHSIKVISFIKQCSTKSYDLLEKKDTRGALQLTTNLQNTCLKVLSRADLNSRTDIGQLVNKILALFDSYQKDLRTIDLNLDEFIKLLERNGKSIMLNKELSPSDSFYVTIGFFLAQSINNLGAIYHLKHKADKAIQNFCLAINILTIMDRYLNAFQIYSLTNILVNMCFCIEDQEKLDEIGNILCNNIFFLENLESKYEELGESRNDLHIQLVEHSRSACLFDLNNRNAKKLSEYKHGKSIMVSKMSLYYNYYANILQKLNKQKEAEFSSSQAALLIEQVEQLENASPSRVKSELTVDNVKKLSARNAKQQDDNFSHMSFKTGLSTTTDFSELGKLTKDNIIYQKFVEAGTMKFKIIMTQVTTLSAIQLIVYNKSKSLLKKVYIYFEDFIQYATQNDPEALSGENDLSKLLSKLAKLLYFKEGDLYLREINFYRSLEELARAIGQI